MSKRSAAKAISVSPTISQLLEISKLDTLYRDLYFQRARKLLETELSFSTYTNLKEQVASIPWLEQQLRAAVERGEWERSALLSEQIRTLRDTVGKKSSFMEQAEIVYEELADIPIDPFSAGFNTFVGASAEMLLERKATAIEILSTLRRADPSKNDFYARRVADFKALTINLPSDLTDEKKGAEPAQLQQQALSALESGDLSLLERLVQQLAQKTKTKEVSQESHEVNLGNAPELKQDLNYSFSDETRDAARDLGLAPARTRSRRHFAYLLPHGWQPWFTKVESKQRSKEQVSRLSYPSGTAEKAREAIEFYLLNPFINSGGTRFQVCLVEEDLLLEAFEEPASRRERIHTKLIAALNLETRWGLSRIDIENVLLQHGPVILERQLKLDPEAFRLVAIPPDIYTHLGSDYGWGQQEMWTHFDGYRLIEGGRLQALAGGDKRFGGTHDVVSFSSNYASDKVMARFAVVQRKRMMSWHHQ